MIEAYKIAANLSITGDAQKKMNELSKAATKLATQFENINKRLPVFVRHLEQFERVSSKLTPLMNGMALSLKATAQAMPSLNEGFAKFNSRAATTERRLERISAKASNARASIAALGNTVGGGGIGTPRTRMGGRGHGAVGGFLAGAGLHFGSPAMMGGMVVAALGAGSFNAYGKFQTQTNQLSGMGFSASDVASGVLSAQSSSVRGVSQNEMLRSIVDIANATGSMGQATKYGSILAKANFANQINMGKTFSPAEEAKMIQFAEIRGRSDPTKIMGALNIAQQAFSASGGRIAPSQLLNFSRMALTAGYKLSDTGLLEMLPVLQELGGFRTGTGFQSGYNRLVGGTGLLRNKKVVSEGERLGILNKKGVMSDANANLLQTAPVEFWTKVLKPAYAAKGITSDVAIGRENSLLLGTTFARLMDAIRGNEDKSYRMLGKNKNAWGIESAYFESLGTNPAKLKALTASFENFETALGKLTSPAVTKGLDYLTYFFDRMTMGISKISSLGSDVPKNTSFMGIPLPIKADSTSPALKSDDHKRPIVLVTNEGVLARSTTNAQSKQFARSVYTQNGQSSINSLLHPFSQGVNNSGVQSQ